MAEPVFTKPVVVVPAAPEPPPFPTLADRRTNTYNSKAYAWAIYYGGVFITRIMALVNSVKANADAAHERAVAADLSAKTALGAADAAVPAGAAAVAAAAQAVPAAAQAVAAAQTTAGDRAYIQGLLPALEAGPVISINGKAGVATLNAAEVGATPTPYLTPAGIALNGGAMNCQLGDYFTEVVNGARTFAFSNIPAGAYFCTLEVLLQAGTITLPAGCVWVGGAVPDLAVNKRHLIDFQRAQTGSGGWIVSARVKAAP